MFTALKTTLKSVSTLSEVADMEINQVTFDLDFFVAVLTEEALAQKFIYRWLKKGQTGPIIHLFT